MPSSVRGRVLPLALVAVAIVSWRLAVDSSRMSRVEPEPIPAPHAKRAVILMIGDGMGHGPLTAASYFRTGSPQGLHVYELPHRGTLNTVGPDGVTDSAAAATAMATGVFTTNGFVGEDPRGEHLETLIELAHAHGWSAGVVTTSSVTDATPAAFTAHSDSRENQLEIARQQVLQSRPEVLLGGGRAFFLPAGKISRRQDGGLILPLIDAGFDVVYHGRQLEKLDTEVSRGLVGLFAPGHLPYDEPSRRTSRFPTLETMTTTAIDILDRDPEGFFLMVEGARIDMAGHSNNLARVIGETLAFDEAVQAVARWASSRSDVVLLVTADHDTGGLRVMEPGAPGEYPQVTWSSREHTEEQVDIFGLGPGTEVFAGAVRDHRWVHAVARARIQAVRLRPPPPVTSEAVLLAHSEPAD